MKRRATKPLPRWATPSVATDRRALRKFFTEEYLTTDDDAEGLGPAGISRLGELVKVLERLKHRRLS